MAICASCVPRFSHTVRLRDAFVEELDDGDDDVPSLERDKEYRVQRVMMRHSGEEKGAVMRRYWREGEGGGWMGSDMLG